MLIDMIQGFKPLYDKEGDKLIVDNYPLKQGLYIIVNDNGIKDWMFIKNKEVIPEDKKEIFNYIRVRDYLSILKQYDTNKSVAGNAKSIHSNNFLSLFIREKKDKPILKGTSLNQTIEEQIIIYFDKFLEWREEELIARKNNNNENPKEFILTTTAEFDIELFKRSKKAITNSLTDLSKLLSDYTLDQEDYLRIFYETSVENYDIEYKRYMIRKIFNKDTYHIFKDDDVYGISDIDLNTNSNKPSLLLKNMKTKIPIRYNFDTLLIAQKLFDFMYFYKVPRYNKDLKLTEYVNSIYKTLYIPTDFNIKDLDLNKYNETNQPVHYITTGNGKSFNIINYDMLYPFDININFKVNNYLCLDNTYSSIEENNSLSLCNNSKINSIFELEKLVNQYFFNFNLISNYNTDKFTNSKKFDLPNNLSCILFSSRCLFHDWFRKGIDLDILEPINKIINNLITEWSNVLDIDSLRIRDILNLKWSILDYLREREGYKQMELRKYLEEIRCDLKIKINDKSDTEKYVDYTEEFYYACGQLIYYLLTQDKKLLKKQQIISRFLQCQTSSKLKIEISKLCLEVTENISAYNYRFNNLYSMIVTYSENSNVQDYMDYLQAGIYQSNIIYEKRKKEKLKYDDGITII